ncbi:MAG: gliding motility-associated C-terminal domain-containing protein [Lewinellaceae bacterium]|nr:gliding motility-associated C-terminal domain-containing protein [Lewinellaceae bacterium]
MKNRFLPALFLSCCALFCSNLNAQNNFAVEIDGPDIMCLSDCDTFTAIITGGPSPAGQIIWTVGNQTITSSDKLYLCAQNLASGPGTFVITVTIFGVNGGTASAEQTITVVTSQPLDIISNNTAPCNSDSTGNPDISCEKVCPNATVTYSVTTSGVPGGTSSPVTWIITGASSYTVNPPFFNSVTVVWGGPGLGSVVVIADPTTGCAGEDALCVTIIAEPEAKFTAAPAPVSDTIQVCKGQTVYFENQSTGTDTYEWFFDDDMTTSMATNPEHTYLSPGIYTVRLIAQSDCLCSDTTMLNVKVLDAEAPTLDCVGTICPGETVTYTASNACPPYVWSVTPNGTVITGGTAASDSITIEWTAGPEGIITLNAQACSGNVCPDPASVHIPIISDDAEIQGEDQVCPNAVEVYSIQPYAGTGFVWTLSGGGTILDGQGTNRVTVEWSGSPNPATTHWLSVVYENCYLGCGGQDSLAIRILSSFIINGPVELCEDANGAFTSKLTSNGQNLVCNWTLLAPDGSVFWTSPAPSASVSAPFGSGPGFYRLLAVPDNPASSCSDQAEWAVNVAPQPGKPAGITGEKNICPGTTYTYEADGIAVTNKIRWTVQNGPGAPVVSFGKKINVTWGSADPRWISVAQVSTNGLNCSSDTTLLPIQSIGMVAINGASTVCEDATDNYAILPLENVDVQWIITPATAGAVANGQGTSAAEIFWTEPGGHVVSVNVCGQAATFPVTVIALPDPMPQHAASVCPGIMTPVQTATPYTAYSWRDAAGVAFSAAPTLNLGAGSYAVQVTDNNGCKGIDEFTIQQSPQPNISITTGAPTGFCNNSSFVTLTTLTNSDGDFTYEWFNNGTPLGVNAATYTTNQYGSYSVQATNSFGCTATAGDIVLFSFCGGGGGGGGGVPGGGGFAPCPAGSVDFAANATGVCDSFDFQLIPGPQYQPGTAAWTFGISGGAVLGSSLLDNPGFTFPNAGIYMAVLRVTLQSGATCIVVDTVAVVAKAQFSSAPDCAGEITNFQDISTFLPGNSIANWAWNFGDPSSGANNISSIRNPAHLFANAGNPLVILTVTGNNGCTTSTTQATPIPTVAPATFSPPALQCAGNALEFVAITTPDITQVAWNFGDMASGASNDATGTPVYHSFTSPSNYAVNTTSTNAYGCTAVYTQIITILPNALSGNITPPNPAPICEGGNVVLTAPAGAASYLWSDSTTTTQTFTATEEGTSTVTLTDASGCTFAPPPVLVEVIPSPDALVKALLTNEIGQIVGTSYPTLSVCEGEEVRLIVQGSGAYGYTWSGGNGTATEIVFSQDHSNQLTVGTHTFTVTVTDLSTGCTSVTAPFVVTVNPVPSGFFVSSNGSCAGSANVLTYNGPQPANWQFIWNNGVQGTTLTTEDPGLFYIRVINEFGCEAKSNNLTILAGPNVAAIPGGCHSRCRPDTLCLPLIPNIVSWQWYYNGNPVPGATGPDFVAEQSGSYYAELVDINGCVNQSDPLTLDLYDGSGNINGQVWSDVNGSGVIDAGDTLVSGISINLLQNGTPVGTGQSSGGSFSFINVLSTSYLVAVDTNLLPAGWEVVIGETPVDLVGCGALGISNLLLHICLPLSSSIQFTACANESVMFNGTAVAAGATQSFLLQTSGGCDSTVVVTVNPIPLSGSSLSVNVCPNEVYDYNGTLLSPGQTQNFVFTNAVGCDSTVTVAVTGVPESSSSLAVSTCPGTTYDYNGTQLAVGQTQNFSFQNVWGCDSTVTVSVSALPVSSSSLAVSTCPGTTYDYNGTAIAIGQSQNFVFPNYLGCDSTVTVTVSEAPTEYLIVDAVACEGDTLFFNGVGIPVGGNHIFNYTNVYGCDSIVEIAVGLLEPTAYATWTIDVCPGQVYTYNGVAIAAGDSASFVLPAGILSCDTVITIKVNELPTSVSAIETGVCPGETFLYQGVTLSAGAVQDFILENAAGCDSVVTVTVKQLPVSSSAIVIDACPGTFYNYNGADIPAGSTEDFILTGFEGCDSTVTVTVNAFPEASFAVQEEGSCESTPTGSLTVSGTAGGLPPYRYSLDGISFQDSVTFAGLAAGDYSVFLEDSNGCLFEKEATVAAFQRLDAGLPDAVLPCDTPEVQMAVIVNNNGFGLNFKWSNGETTPFATFTDAGPVWVEVTDHCETVHIDAAVNWADASSGANFMYMPNVMSPTSIEPDNSEFKPFFHAGLTILKYQFEVFDRWGNKMFGTTQPDQGWRGKLRADDLQPGVFVWYVKATVFYCGRERELYFEGDVTVVR